MNKYIVVPGVTTVIVTAAIAGALTAASYGQLKELPLSVSQPQISAAVTPSVLSAQSSNSPGPSASPSVGVSAVTSQPAATPSPTPAPRPNPLAGRELYVDPRSQSALAEATLRSTNPRQAEIINKIARQPQAKWLNGPADTGPALLSYLKSTGSRYPVLVAYYMPFRDCGDTSQQGAPTSNAYRQWINSLGAALGTKSAAIILEPDALARLDCLSAMRQAERLADLNYAVQKLATKPNLAVYLDAGHAGWLSIDMAAERLKSAGIDSATGFSLGVSHFTTAAQNAAYGQAVSRLVGGQHFIIDTSRSGRGEAGAGQWCNPPGRGLGPVPTIAPGPAGVDAYLWVKRPGESDGTCNGGPGAGQWWLDYAVALVSNS